MPYLGAVGKHSAAVLLCLFWACSSRLFICQLQHVEALFVLLTQEAAWSTTATKVSAEGWPGKRWRTDKSLLADRADDVQRSLVRLGLALRRAASLGGIPLPLLLSLSTLQICPKMSAGRSIARVRRVRCPL